jgi:cytochrome c553
MRMSVCIFLAALASAQAPPFQQVGTVSQLMIDIIYPSSDALFYIERSPPGNEVEWNVIRARALMLAESGNLLMMASRARDQSGWVKDSKMLIDVGAAAYKAAAAKDVTAIVALNDQLNAACVTCHAQYRPNYRRKP